MSDKNLNWMGVPVTPSSKVHTVDSMTVCIRAAMSISYSLRGQKDSSNSMVVRTKIILLYMWDILPESGNV